MWREKGDGVFEKSIRKGLLYKGGIPQLDRSLAKKGEGITGSP